MYHTVNPTERAQSAPLGIALLLGITILGTTAVVGLGGVALTDAQESSNLARAEQSLTQFDSQAAQVALGDPTVRTTNFGRVDGEFRVNPLSEPDSGTITITHVDYDGSSNHVLYTGDLGSVVYENGGTEIAYQGGGIWLREEDGGARMISPPEFHYRQGALTFPVIQTTGSAAVSGSPDATISRAADTGRKFPDPSSSYPDPDGDPYQNPIENGYVTVTVESDYYEGWAKYFRTRTDGTVTVDDANQRVTLELSTLGATGSFGIPSDSANGGGSQEVQGLGDGHSLTDYIFRIFPKDDQESAFNNLRWSMYVNEGSKKFEVALRANGNSGCGDAVDLAIYYSDDAHSSYEGWEGSETVSCSDVDGDGNDEYYIDVDLVDGTAGPDLTYSSLSGSQLAHYKSDVSGASFQDPGTLPGHSSGTHTSDRDYDSSVPDTETRDFVVAHYFAELGPNFELKVEDQQNGNAAGVDESSSQGYIDYGGGGQVVTFLHVTENRIEVDLD